VSWRFEGFNNVFINGSGCYNETLAQAIRRDSLVVSRVGQHSAFAEQRVQP
jgi:hypothetical protein